MSFAIGASVLGAVAGALHAAGLARAARRERSALGVLGRVVLSGVVLAISARAHHLGAAASGWAAGWIVNGTREYARLR